MEMALCLWERGLCIPELGGDRILTRLPGQGIGTGPSVLGRGLTP